MNATCPICRDAENQSSLCKATLGTDEHDLAECGGCGTRYIWPPPSEDELEHFYAPQYYGSDWYKQQGSGMAFARRTLNGHKKGRFLDIGCGLGYFIDSIRRHAGWEVYGVEHSASAVRYAREKLGLDVHRGELTAANFSDDFFDYIQIRNVLEHVTDPMSLLSECRRVIKEDGTLHLFVPNGRTDSLDLIRYQKETGRPGLSKSGHLFFFPARALRRMCEASGFEIERERTYGIRRGLAILGLWPRFKDWKPPYDLDEFQKQIPSNEINLPAKKERPDLYYLYRHLRMHARMLPGMRPYGLDYELILRPKR